MRPFGLRRVGRRVDHLLEQAVVQAELAVERGDLPFGAVLQLPDGRTFAAGNEVRSRRDPLAHAELGAIRAAIASGEERAPVGSVLACSGEPCPMCLTSARLYGLGSIICITTMRDAGRAGLPTRALYRFVRASRRSRGVELRPGRDELHARALRAIAPAPTPLPGGRHDR